MSCDEQSRRRVIEDFAEQAEGRRGGGDTQPEVAAGGAGDDPCAQRREGANDCAGPARSSSRRAGGGVVMLGHVSWRPFSNADLHDAAETAQFHQPERTVLAGPKGPCWRDN